MIYNESWQVASKQSILYIQVKQERHWMIACFFEGMMSSRTHLIGCYLHLHLEYSIVLRNTQHTHAEHTGMKIDIYKILINTRLKDKARLQIVKIHIVVLQYFIISFFGILKKIKRLFSQVQFQESNQKYIIFSQTSTPLSMPFTSNWPYCDVTKI